LTRQHLIWYNVIRMKSGTTGWGYFQQGNEQEEKLEMLGQKLNLAINCPIHYPAFGKRLFECKCGVTFPLYIVEGRSEEELAKIHSEGAGQ